jgi:7,8-dihydropterin-6-yl-methyl-4-(beta-D-ribofuranosyl)aminobenzene 5'-phosphate synthase
MHEGAQSKRMTSASALPLTIQLLVDNEAQPGLRAEHGFAAWVDTPAMNLLFDTGQGPALVDNAERLALDLERADAIVLSHGHYDHSGGLRFARRCAPRARLYLHPDALRRRFSVRRDDTRSIGMSEATRTDIGECAPSRICWLDGPAQLSEDVGVTGPIARRTLYEDSGGPFYWDEIGCEADPIPDDTALWLRTTQGLVVVVGCSHAGVINTLELARELSGESRLRAVIGGFHLGAASDERLRCTIAALRDLEVERVIACHCTGKRATEVLARSLAGRVTAGRAGERYVFD